MSNTNRLQNRTVLISGASIAGPALAYWLSYYGFRPTIVEKAPTLREGGYAIDIRGAAQKVVERMGILEEIRNIHTHMQGMTYVNSNNKQIAHITPEQMAGGGDLDIEFLRRDLAHLLYQLTREQTDYLFNDSITSLVERENGVQVTFERTPPRTFDLVVGADGVHSNVRTQVFGEESQFSQYLGYYVAIFTTPNHLNLDHQELIYRMPGKIASMYSARDNREAKAMFYFTSPPLTYDRHDVFQQKHLLAQAFSGEQWEIPRLLESMWQAPDFYFDSVDQIHLDQWAKGRIALVGDAGYCASPLSGQGTSLALVGAYVLAGELSKASGEYRLAFANYQQEMRAYVELNQKAALGHGQMLIPPTPFHIWFTTQNIRLFPYLPWQGLIMKAIRKPYDAIALKDYEGVSIEYATS